MKPDNKTHKQNISQKKKICCFSFLFVLFLLGISIYTGAVYFMQKNRDEFQLIKLNASKIEKLGKVIIDYANNNNGILPKADDWCDMLCDFDKSLTKQDFKSYLSQGYECDYSFNKNASEKNLSSISGNMILLFEASGKWNLNGSEELLKTNSNRKFIISVFTSDAKPHTYDIKSYLRDKKSNIVWE